MRFIIFGIGSLLIIGFLFWMFRPESVVTNYPSPGIEIVAFGDSLIEGVGATSGGDLVSLLSKGTGQTIKNLGVSGDTTRDGIARLDEVTSLNPKVVILLLGGNDAIKKIPIAETQSNLSVIIEEIHSTGAVVLLLGVRGGLLSDGYKDMYEDLANEYQTAFVSDVLSGVFGRSNLMSDPIHPNNAGYQKISERVLPILESVI